MNIESEMLVWWNTISSKEENDIDDEYINRQLRWREIERSLEGVETILDIGGATGAFSIPLAKKGYKVTHIDLSDKMIEIAKANSKGIGNIDFIQVDARDLSEFGDKKFDLVLNQDGAISFSGKDYAKVIKETCRVTRKKVLVTASNKACMIATWLNYSLNCLNNISPAVEEMFNHGYWEKSQFEDNEKIAETCFNIDSFKAFTPNEIKELLENNDMEVIFSRSLGSLTHLYLLHLYRQFPNSIQSKNISITNEFINLCERYDKEIMPNGPGSFRRAGIIALAERKRVGGDIIS